jgi:hypothetical protein
MISSIRSQSKSMASDNAKANWARMPIEQILTGSEVGSSTPPSRRISVDFSGAVVTDQRQLSPLDTVNDTPLTARWTLPSTRYSFVTSIALITPPSRICGSRAPRIGSSRRLCKPTPSGYPNHSTPASQLKTSGRLRPAGVVIEGVTMKGRLTNHHRNPHFPGPDQSWRIQVHEP